MACFLVLAASLGCDASNGQAHDGGSGDGGGRCGDAGSLQLCGASCVDLSSDVRNCGSCGNACASAALCCSGTCVETSTCGFAVTQVLPVNGFQNGGDYITLAGAGFATGLRAYIADGRAPVRVLDASHALVQTPPGPVGARDVKIVLGGLSATTPQAFEYVAAGLDMVWAQKPMMQVRGEDPGIGVAMDGRVLVAGGTTVPDNPALSLASAELYERATDKVTVAGNQMSTVRWQNSVVPMLTGKLLVVGGACEADGTTCTGDATLADLFDPATNLFKPTAMPLAVKRAYTRAVLLVDGRVLIASANDPSVEIYDPALDTFTTVAHTTVRVFGFMVRLRDGRVLYGGGDKGETSAEVFDSDTNTFQPVGPMAFGRSMLSAHTLPDGRAIVIAGASMSAGAIMNAQTTMEVFDPVANTFSTLSYQLTTPRAWHASALVRDGTILVMGGYTMASCDSSTAGVEQVDPVMGTVKMFPSLPNTNTEWNAVTLLDGSVLGVGGGACGTLMALPDLDFLPGTGPG